MARNNATVGIMLDIESLSLSPRACVTQVAGIVFPLTDPETELRRIEVYLPVQPQIEGLKREMSFDTIAWWMQQDEKARKRFAENSGNDLDELTALVRSIHRKIGEEIDKAEGAVEVWAKGPQFDIVNIESLFTDIGLTAPWKYDSVMDLRSLMRLAGVSSADVDASGIVKHVAIEDCRFQIRCYIEAIKQLHART